MEYPGCAAAGVERAVTCVVKQLCSATLAPIDASSAPFNISAEFKSAGAPCFATKSERATVRRVEVWMCPETGRFRHIIGCKTIELHKGGNGCYG